MIVFRHIFVNIELTRVMKPVSGLDKKQLPRSGRSHYGWSGIFAPSLPYHLGQKLVDSDRGHCLSAKYLEANLCAINDTLVRWKRKFKIE
jgi:hypothetical protein